MIDTVLSKFQPGAFSERDRNRLFIEFERRTRDEAMACARRMRDHDPTPESLRLTISLARSANRRVVERLRKL